MSIYTHTTSDRYVRDPRRQYGQFENYICERIKKYFGWTSGVPREFLEENAPKSCRLAGCLIFLFSSGTTLIHYYISSAWSLNHTT